MLFKVKVLRNRIVEQVWLVKWSGNLADIIGGVVYREIERVVRDTLEEENIWMFDDEDEVSIEVPEFEPVWKNKNVTICQAY